jgi:hypothetical protein
MQLGAEATSTSAGCVGVSVLIAQSCVPHRSSNPLHGETGSCVRAV